MRVAVAGGTGVVGRHAVAVLRERGHGFRVIARSTGVDVATGDGLEAALTGVDAVVDTTNVPTMRRSRASASTPRRRPTCSTRRSAPAWAITSCCRSSASTRSTTATTSASGARRSWPSRATSRSACCGRRSSTSSPFRCWTGRGLGGSRSSPAMRTQPVAAREVGEALADLAVAPAVGPGPRPRRAQGTRPARPCRPGRATRRGAVCCYRPGASTRPRGPGIGRGRAPAGPERDAGHPDLRGLARSTRTASSCT